MVKELRTGVYICQVGIGAADSVDLQAVGRYAEKLQNVVLVEIVGSPAELDPVVLSEKFKMERIDRVVVAADSPGYFKPVFVRAMVLAGGDPERVVVASFVGNGAGVPGSTERAKAVLNCSIHGVPYGLAAEPKYATTVDPDTLVIGGGVGGIQAALEIAGAGKQVFLVEKSGTIGGKMAMFDKTFPTLDCAACILTPKMVAVGQDKNITLMTYSEVTGVSGSPGAYKVKVLKHARRVDEAACVACNACAEICPTIVPSEFDAGISTRKAIYIPFPQAVPNSFLVDETSCLWVTSGGKKCGACVKKCAKEAIHLDAQDEEVVLTVGNIIVATGYQVFDASRIERYGYGKFPNVLTALEYERLTNASGPTGGNIVMKALKHNKRKKVDEWVFSPENPKPKSVAIIHCIGSRDHNYNRYCSRVCCMYSLKFAHLVREKLPEASCYEFYIDMRAYGKNYEEFLERIREEGVFLVRGRTAKIEEQGGQMHVKGEDITGDKVLDFPVDMVILSVGLEPVADSEALSGMLGIARDADGWYAERDYNSDPTGTERGGIFVAGVCQGPKDIPDTVAQASEVAARVLKSIISGHIEGSRGDMTLTEIEAGFWPRAQA
ncbi:MAG: CoB--CoM heterodisulfide reductase iron-sulfur subunit A family protein [Deltaproteobacteria bacterium]|nr:CoB--CoM heterodisulfide reductase iron-sulfur subunit A family protein [Deltaproteobacteria bacterium]